MGKRPFFSIVIPTYNRSWDLHVALCSVLRQQWRDYEIIVSDNCSTDDTEEIVKAFGDTRIRYFRNQTNIGMIANQKAAIERACGRYLFLLGDDDIMVHETSLGEIYQEIINQKNPGYLRVNYVSISKDRKHIFSYKVHKPFRGNYYLPPGRTNREVMSFIRDTDNYFFSGLVFRNSIPRTIRMIDADPSPWIDIAFYVTKKFGGYFIRKRHVLAFWSRRTKESEDHGFYMPVNGRLKAERYFSALNKKLSKREYRDFLFGEVQTIYGNLLPAIKVNVGNKNFAVVVRRMLQLTPQITRLPSFWLRFFLSVVTPRYVLRIVRDLYLSVLMHTAKVENEKELRSALGNLMIFSQQRTDTRQAKARSRIVYQYRIGAVGSSRTPWLPSARSQIRGVPRDL